MYGIVPLNQLRTAGERSEKTLSSCMDVVADVGMAHKKHLLMHCSSFKEACAGIADHASCSPWESS